MCHSVIKPTVSVILLQSPPHISRSQTTEQLSGREAGAMADIQKTVVKVLICVEKVTSFASSFVPICGMISPLVRLLRKGLQGDEAHALEKDFQALHCKIGSISAKNRQCLPQIRMDEVNETYGKHEEFIKYQYKAFGNMVTGVKKNPDAADQHMSTFKGIYKDFKADLGLDIYYRGVMGEGSVFGQPLLLVYLEHCGRDRTVMEQRCSHLRLLFHMGLIALMAYTAVTEDDEEEVAQKWQKRMEEIQSKMEEVLSQCKEASPP
ncbi:protein rapunzel-like [Gadus chalcogrammus]|uniref:protein rapunzel-like n=1 Tax=Gadus chalcogrammus TaxID=1042646 RepID=UPI0024C4D991|nr:protein rapunzel-like [Gadus chalcogrammus]